ncbi:ATP-binding cassette sub-family C member 4-like isoform X3 [Ptychodera flava]|uniref:ATP-binding cassette sub-family C member 4-like isoform X3 n=1 Tax=Ptychodera flava TaxID=63121 RepID=UPI00396A6EC0
MDEFKKEAQKNPIQTANIISKLFYWWLNPLFKHGYSRALEVKDMYKTLPEDSAEKLSDDLERQWNKELRKHHEGGKASLAKAIGRTFGFQYALIGFVVLFEETFKIISPILLGNLISYFSPGSTMTKFDAYMYATGISLCVIMLMITHHPYFFVSQRIGMRIRISCCSLIYRKALRLSHIALGQTTTGQIVNLLSNDVNRFDVAMIFIHYLWIGPLESIVVLVLLWREIGPSCLAGFAILVIMMPFQGLMGKVFSKLRAKTAVQTDERVRIMNEIISGMRVIKMYTWEKLFGELIKKVRRKEIRLVRRSNELQSFIRIVLSYMNNVIVFLVVITYIMRGNFITPRTVYFTMTVFEAIRFGVFYAFPLSVHRLSEGLIAVKRVQKFLLLEELDKTDIVGNVSLRPKPGDCEVVAKEVTGTWDELMDTPTLHDISFEVKPGQLLAVIGPVGSGKSSLLLSLLGEMPVSEGHMKVRGKIAYASQQPWVFSASMKQNILFGNSFDKKKYDKVLEVCALKKDIQILPNGDLTMVGERGVTLSGGQRARVNLARAVYTDADVYLLDDPLSAVDSAVGRHLFDKCIKEYLSSKPCILVTHQLQYLAKADKILILKEGEMAGYGTFDELMSSGIDFASLLKKDDDEDTSKKRESFLGSPAHHQKSMSSADIANVTSSMISVATVDSEMVQETGAKQEEEDKVVGTVGWKIYVEYFKAGAGCLGFTLLVFLLVLGQAVFVMADMWLSYWANIEESRHAEELIAVNGNISSNVTHTPVEDNFIFGKFDSKTCILIYSGLVISVLIFGLARAFYFFKVCVNASKNLHNSMFASIIRAPILFFDTNPVGRILNRFSRDTGFMDDVLPWCFFDFVQSGLLVLGIILVAGVINPWVFIPTVPLAVLFVFVRKYFLATARDIKRLEGVTRSPVFSHLSASLQGLWTIRAFNAEPIFTREFDTHQDLHTEAWFLFLTTSRWLAVRLDALCACFVIAVAFCSIFAADRLNAGLVGLSLTYALTLMGMFQWCVRQSAEVENQMTSVERVVSYIKIPPEAPLETDFKPPDPKWPKYGVITMEGTSFKYSDEAPYVLKNLYVCIRSQEKVGVVGRTGAGKSSLISALFRMAEPVGLTKIDGVDICDLGLHDLRSKISIIPQDPVLFSGTLRKNLDPFTQHSDAELWNSLEQVQLRSAVDELPGGLEAELAESGSNLSVGQRQLVCLARAILRNNKILIIDEATANVDPRTDKLIQQTIRTRFKHCTVITIAHRLNTVMDSDRILVMSEGRIVEFDEPHLLLQDKKGQLWQFVSQTGREQAKQLHNIARETYNQNNPEDTLWIPISKRPRLCAFSSTDDIDLRLESTV